jgi:hypothetical protein
MVNVMGVDIAWERPTPAEIVGVGAHFVARYFSSDDSKDLHADEVIAYPAAGLSIVTVQETTTGRATQGRAAGVADAKSAEAKRAAVGLPATHIHHFAVDSDVSWASVQAYFDGAASVIGLARTGVYGGYQIIEGAYAHGLRYLWQTSAWSKGLWSTHATLRQTGVTTLHGVADVDNAVMADYGQYPRPEDIVTPADIAAIAAAVWDHTELNAATDTQVRMGAVLRYSDFVQLGQTQALTAQIGALTATVTALAKTVGAAGGLTAAQIQSAAQAGATAALTQVGHALDGTK